MSKIDVTDNTDTVNHNLSIEHRLTGSILLEGLARMGIPDAQTALDIMAVALVDLAIHQPTGTQVSNFESAKATLERAFAFMKENCQCGIGVEHDHVH